MLCSYSEICIVRGHFSVPNSFTNLKKSEGKCFLEPVIVSALNQRHCFSPSLSFTHVAAFSFGGSQTTHKASVKWDLAGTWTELAGMVGDIIWKWRPALSMDREAVRGSRGRKWELHTVMIDVPREREEDGTRPSSSPPLLCVIPVFLHETLNLR